MEKEIFFDNNATTRMDPRVATAMMEELYRSPSNPSSVHASGRRARSRLIVARETIAKYLKVIPHELLFTSSATEALTTLLLGLEIKGEIITSPLEHAAVYSTVNRLEKQGVKVTYLPTDAWGAIRITDLEKALSPSTQLIILNAVNSETGVKNPIDEIAALAYSKKIPFIVDAVALLGKELFAITRGVSAMVFSPHKFHGPQGIGCAWIRKQLPFKPLITGGAQEYSRRGGTENLAGIIGCAKAIELLESELPKASEHMQELRDLFEQKLKEKLPDIMINGQAPRICNVSNITFPGIDGEALFIHLDKHGIAASIGSACSAGSIEPSRVLLNMGIDSKLARSTLRFSFSRMNTKEEIEKAAAVIIVAVKDIYARI